MNGIEMMADSLVFLLLRFKFVNYLCKVNTF